MPEFLRKLFESDFMPHGMCYLWQPGLVWLHVISDVLIALAYLSIPLTLIYFIRRRRDIPFDWMFLCFGVFIVACGATHGVEVWNVWHANYWMAGGVKVITALTSIPTAILLLRLVPKGLAIPSPAQLAAINEGLNREIATREEAERKLQQLSAELLRARDDERQRIARDIHDGIGQYVSGLSMGVARLRTVVDMNRMEVRRQFSDLYELIPQLGDEIRNLAYVLHPPMLEELGIESALNWYVRSFAKRSGIEVSLWIAPEFPRVSSELEIALFRIVQESLTNVQRHSESAMASVRLAQDAREIVLNIEDGGRGMASPSSVVVGRRYGAGIPGIRERVRQFNGTLDIESDPGKGVKICVRLPVARRERREPIQ